MEFLKSQQISRYPTRVKRSGFASAEPGKHLQQRSSRWSGRLFEKSLGRTIHSLGNILEISMEILGISIWQMMKLWWNDMIKSWNYADMKLNIAESCSGASLPSPKTPTAPVTPHSPDLEATLESPECSPGLFVVSTPGLFVVSTPFGNQTWQWKVPYKWRFEWINQL